MVLQRGVPVPIWGKAAPDARVEVRFAGQHRVTHADDAGAWRLTLDPMPASGQAATLTAMASGPEGRPTRAQCDDVRVGDVWLCSGQSNMAFGLENARGGDEAIAGADLPAVRVFNAQRDPEHGWRVSTPEAAPDFSAVGFFMARHLHAATGVPVGIVTAALGGTNIATWTSRDAYDHAPDLKTQILEGWRRYRADLPSILPAELWRAKLDEAGGDAEAARDLIADPRSLAPGANFDRVLRPIIPYAVRGVAWYHGESDAWGFGVAERYEAQLRLLLSDWRRWWDVEYLPFLIVQLPLSPPDPPGPRPNDPEPWTLLTEAQHRVAAQTPHTYLAVTADLGVKHEIHPNIKAPIGQRLALLARRHVLGHDVAADAPTMREVAYEGGAARIRFDHAAGGLTSGGAVPRGFAVAGRDRCFFWADATIEDDMVACSSPDVPEPVAVRYAMAAGSPNNLYNAAGLPAGPFRTDAWPMDMPAEQPRTLAAARVTDEPKDDAPPAAEGFTVVHTLRPADDATDAWLGWDDAALHVVFHCRQDMTRLRNEARDAADPRLWGDDNVQLLLDTDLDRRTYLRFVFNPAAVVAVEAAFNHADPPHWFYSLDTLEHLRGATSRPGEGIEASARLESDGWRLTARLPWHALGLHRPVVGRRMGLQLTRTVAATGEHSEWTAAGRDRNTAAMMPPSATGGRVLYHPVSRFGTLELVGLAAPAPRAGPRATSADRDPTTRQPIPPGR